MLSYIGIPNYKMLANLKFHVKLHPDWHRHEVQLNKTQKVT